MVSHLSLGVSDLARARAFYDAALAPLGIVRVWQTEGALGYGEPGGADELALFVTGEPLPEAPRFHLAFWAPDRPSVDAFHAAALAAGGSDEGRPGPRPRYGEGYYAAFVRDPDGHKLEAKAR
ncbi:MAG: VOC family protein [Myxococcota bacterium]